MKLVSVSLVKNEEYWIWYALTSVHAHVDEILVFDNGSVDATVDVVRGMHHVADKLTLFEGFGEGSEHATREAIVEECRRRGATHMLIVDGDEIHVDRPLGAVRAILEMQEHDPPLHDPPRNHGRPGDCTPTEGVVVKNVGLRCIHPGYEGPHTIAPFDLGPDHDHGCYNYSVRVHGMRNLRGNGLEWGRYGMLETDGMYVQSSAQTLWLPSGYYFHTSFHPRSRVDRPGAGYGRRPRNVGSVPAPDFVVPPAVLLREDGTGNPTLEAWGMGAGAFRVPGAGCSVAGLRERPRRASESHCGPLGATESP